MRTAIRISLIFVLLFSGVAMCNGSEKPLERYLSNSVVKSGGRTAKVIRSEIERRVVAGSVFENASVILKIGSESRLMRRSRAYERNRADEANISVAYEDLQYFGLPDICGGEALQDKERSFCGFDLESAEGLVRMTVSYELEKGTAYKIFLSGSSDNGDKWSGAGYELVDDIEKRSVLRFIEIKHGGEELSYAESSLN